MKGVIFTEFLSFVESQFDLAMVDHLITATDPKSGGSYTSVGTYDVHELFAMVAELSKQTEKPVGELVKAFGGHLFKHFTVAHAETLGDVATTEQLLSQVDDRIHVEVRKLYPDAELPSIVFRQIDEKISEVLYNSSRPLADLAEGLIETSICHFGDPISLIREDLAPGDGTAARFTLTRA